MFYATTEKNPKVEGQKRRWRVSKREAKKSKEQEEGKKIKGRRQRDFKRAPSRPRAHSSVVLIHQLFAPEERTKCPLRLGRLSARGERAQKSAIAQTRFRLLLPFRCWRPSSRFRSRSRFFFCFFLDGISLSLPPLERLTAMLATLSANEERMARCMKLQRGEGGSGRGGMSPARGSTEC